MPGAHQRIRINHILHESSLRTRLNVAHTPSQTRLENRKLKSDVVDMVRIRRRRSQTEVIEKVLVSALNGANATSIVYGANLDFKRFRALQKNLVEKMLLKVEHTSKRRIYRTTERGKDLINLMRKVEKVI